ncbi:MAG: phage virion morphogenesis protein [Zoogloea sp.]|uniref:phage virion morphogenesis protein n=1 Tax=Zoogloea sp. TaxID=49181 RepID=UPI00262F84E5|nr:phage virion morphogenesis protein [Zoogloea sp.]MDD3328344.1 phage virion morphogenesis protein [Zoogloea sp.]
MPASITINDRLVVEFLAALGKKAGNLRGLMDSLGQKMETRVSNRFETRTDPSGAPWIQWADSTSANYPDDGNGTLLDRYGDMLDSLGHQADDSSVTYGFAQPYAAYHEFGTTRMPRRGLLTENPEAGTLSADDQRAVLETIEAYFMP